MNNLLSFYGEECPHCLKMHPLLDKLENEANVKVERIEVWHNDENAKKLEGLPGYADCGGVPFFFNSKTKKSICGEATYDELKAWALE